LKSEDVAFGVKSANLIEGAKGTTEIWLKSSNRASGINVALLVLSD
jgi:hypothetical protein